MKRIKDEYLDLIEKEVSFERKNILEIGGGNGSRTVQIAKRAGHITSIEPNAELVNFAQKNNSALNIAYHIGSAEELKFPDQSFDVVFFTLSLHHVPQEKMSQALSEAARVVVKEGYIIFLEPAEEGTFFEAEISFDACDGDEREQKRSAYNAIKNFTQGDEVAEMHDETVFQFESVEDFVKNLHPKRNAELIKDFLEKNNFILKASRRINIFKLK